MSKWLVLGITLVFLLSEIAVKLNPVWGFLFYVILLSGLLLGISFEKEEKYKSLLFLMVLPVVRIAGLLIEIPSFWKTILNYYILAFLSIFYYFSFRLDVGFTKKRLAFLPIAIAIGFGLGFICQKVTGINLDASIILLVSIISFSEELFFRGLIQKSLEENGDVFAIIVSSILYAVFSLALGWKFALFALVMSLISSISFRATKNIFLSIALNFSFQIALVIMV